MTFHSIVRNWCKTYKYMLDSPDNGNRRFYLTDTTSGVVDIAAGISNSFSPCVVMESTIEGYADGGKIYRNYPVYFFVRAKSMASGDAAAEAKEEAWMHAQNFLTWLREKHDNDPTETGEYARINLEDRIMVETVGPIENGWFGVLVQFERLELLNLCIDESMYIEQPEKNQ